MSQQTNRWTRWHPRHPVLVPETEDEFAWIISLQERAKSFHDRNTNERDIIHQRERAIQIGIVKFICPECSSRISKRTSLRIHLGKEHLFGRKEATKIAKSAQETLVAQTLTNADIYYEVIRPRKNPPLPKTIEIDLKAPLSKNTIPPTGEERERYDQKIARWRKHRKTFDGDDVLERLPNGLFLDPGLSGNWWYYIPNVWRREAKEGKGAWLEPTEKECLNWSTLELPKRVLILLCILPEELPKKMLQKKEKIPRKFIWKNEGFQTVDFDDGEGPRLVKKYGKGPAIQRG